ncbi:MAG TPA: sporulation initiation factor Spo0A C-terminal domain-containing protein [Clostridia bacterium]|nr:sporulation initiation factor Spo0A C-terminal domain-containing protein [Clostridia bacterium]
MRKFNIILCESNPSLTSSANTFFAEDNYFTLFTCTRYADFAEQYAHEIDAVIVDTDFSNLKEVFQTLYPGCKIILTSTRLQDDLPNFINEAPIDYSFYKPYSFVDLRNKLLALLNAGVAQIRLYQNKNIDERLSNIFIRAGIPPHIKGYQFLREAVKLSVSYPDMINCITKKLYPTVAATFDTSSSKVERAIRHAIEVAWNRGKIENINSIFGIKIYNKGEKPTNGELIALVADKIMIESNSSN